MRAAILIAMLGAMLLVGWLVVQSMNPPGSGEKAPIVAIDRARAARDRAEQAARDAGRTLDNASRE
jgi:hypothetical protein